MPITDTEFFKLGKKILEQLKRDDFPVVIHRHSDRAISGVIGVLNTVSATLSSILLDTAALVLKDFAEQTTLLAVNTTLGGINTSLSADIQTNIINALGDVELAVDNSVTVANKGYGLVIDFLVTAIGGGTTMDIRIQAIAGHLYFIENIAEIIVGGTRTRTITEVLTSGSNRTLKTLAPSGPIAVGGHNHAPFRNSGTPGRHSEGFSLKSGHEIRIVITGMAVSDRYFLSIEGTSRDTTLPTIDTTNSTVTITPNTDEHNID